MRRLLFILLLCSLPAFASAQNDCATRLSGADKKDFDRAVEAYGNKRFQQCISLMRKVSQRNRTAPDPYFYMGAAGVRSGERPATIRQNFNRLFSLCPDYPNALAYYYMAVVHYSYEEYEEAVAQLNRYFDIANAQRNPEYDVVYEEASNYLYWSEFLLNARQNRVPFFPSLVRGASSVDDELLPYLSPDGEDLYYLRYVVPVDHNRFYSRDGLDRVLRLYHSRRRDTAFSAGEQLQSPFNVYDQEGNPTMTADGRTMYYAVMRREKGYNNCDIYVTHLTDDGWTTSESTGRNVNGERTWESEPSVSPDGQYLYFASTRDGGYGGSDIWVCRRLPNDDWSRAENMGPAVNTPGDEKSPFIHADGRTLYFASNGWQGFGGYDMYFIDINNTYLQRPTNLGLPINSEGDDFCFGVTTDGKRGYFAGKSTEWSGVGGSDIFTFELYPAAQPQEMSIVKGRLRSADGQPVGGVAYVLHGKSEADRYTVHDDGYFALALAARETNTVIFCAEGYVPRTLSGNAQRVRRDMAASDFTLLAAKQWERYPLPLPKDHHGRLLLPLGDEATATLDAFVDFLLQNPRVRIRIESTRLDEAQAIYDYFVSRQLRKERLEFKAVSSLAAPQLVITEM